MIIGYIGDMGSGKTLSMVKQAYELYKKGHKIYSNFHLSFPHTILTLEEILNYAESNTNFVNSVWLLDEITLLMDSRRSSSSKNLYLSYVILQSRKRSFWLFFTTQYIHMVDRRLRSATNCLVECSFRTVVKGGQKINICLNKYNVFKMNKVVLKVMTYNPDKYFHLYNTNEIIRQL
jgi:hypothetical protein